MEVEAPWTYIFLVSRYTAKSAVQWVTDPQFRIGATLWYGRYEESALEAEGTERKLADETNLEEQSARQTISSGGGSAVSEPGR